MVNRSKRILLSWSGGKDSALMMVRLQRQDDVDVVGFFSSVDETTRMVPFHGISDSVLEQQALVTGLPLFVLPLPTDCSDDFYEQRMGQALEMMEKLQIDAVAFGDLFLDDVRAFRERVVGGSGFECLFPLWGEDSGDLAREVIECGLQADVCGIDTRRLGEEQLGRRYDRTFLEELPSDVDPCGENGEFHTFVHNGPMFREPIVATSVGHAQVGDYIHLRLTTSL